MLLVAGTRPEVVKLAPVKKALARANVESAWFWTGQSPDLAKDAFQTFEQHPDFWVDLERRDSSLMELFACLAHACKQVIRDEKPSYVVVQGDTLSAAVAAQQAFLAGVPVAHVEAGLRSWDLTQPFPEEAARVWIDSIAEVKFAPTTQASRTLSGEVYVTGNTIVDALSMVPKKDLWGRKYAVVTMHRRENQSPKDVAEVCRAVVELVYNGSVERVIWPLHPTAAIAGYVPKLIRGCKGVDLVKPLPYDQMVNLLRGAHVILTDSGGLQEEALALNVPCFVLRETTERPEGVQAGGARLVGTDYSKIVGWVTWVCMNPEEHHQMASAVNPYGDGKAANRIAAVLRAKLSGRKVNEKIVSWTGG